MEEEWLNPKMNRKLVVGEREMCGYIAFKKGAVVPPHHHLSEQITFVLNGSLRFRIDGSDYVVRDNEALVIPSHAVHEALAEEDTLELDFFSPLRHDWLKKTDRYLREGARAPRLKKVGS
jgi:quercetin dioxygenase-like cupin family protein